jgi:hypothetical protein
MTTKREIIYGIIAVFLLFAAIYLLFIYPPLCIAGNAHPITPAQILNASKHNANIINSTLNNTPNPFGNATNIAINASNSSIAGFPKYTPLNVDLFCHFNMSDLQYNIEFSVVIICCLAVFVLIVLGFFKKDEKKIDTNGNTGTLQPANAEG